MKIVGCLFILAGFILYCAKTCYLLQYKYEEWTRLESVLMELLRNNRYARQILSVALQQALGEMTKEGTVKIETEKCMQRLFQGKEELEVIWSDYVEEIMKVIPASPALKMQLLRLGNVLGKKESDVIEIYLEECISLIEEEMGRYAADIKGKRKAKMAVGGFICTTTILVLI